MANNTGSPTTEAYLAASQMRLNLVFEGFWAKLAARQMDDPARTDPLNAIMQPEGKAAHPQYAATSAKTYTYPPWRPGTHTKWQVAAGSKIRAQANGTRTSTTPQDGGSLSWDAMWHTAAARPHTPAKSMYLHKANRPQSNQQPPHGLGIG
ncbi:Hypothetical predicted protein [Pelobates cultripes]|uniref:Uncharacterized protein n=1 Tax=Pelobates cultripes TaxID=61616 RepID=A0AAD1VKH9_PELCU|nr:Hypothetical predicted protein [Pelobates cultripes]